VYLTVYQTLLNYHRAIPADSIYRCFPMVRYFEELIPLSKEDFTEVAECEIIFLGRATRRWHYPVYLPENFRVIG
jgi:nitrate reductase beta subunit